MSLLSPIDEGKDYRNDCHAGEQLFNRFLERRSIGFALFYYVVYCFFMIQDIYPKKLYNEYRPGAVPSEDSLIVSFKENTILIKENESGEDMLFPTSKDIQAGKEDLIYLFSVDSQSFFLLQKEIDPPEGYSYQDFRGIRGKDYLSKELVFAAFTAYQLSEWYTVTRFCGKCGSANENDKIERARICPKCGNKIYPRINPAVIIGVTDKDTNRIVLTKYRTGFAHNALVAGFTEIGETLEGTVEREVMEEVGLKVNNIRYYKSQPWGIASDILTGFFCDVQGGKDIKMDASELKYAEWVSPEDIVLQPTNYSLTNEMMKLFKEKGYDGTINY